MLPMTLAEGSLQLVSCYNCGGYLYHQGSVPLCKRACGACPIAVWTATGL